MYLIFQSNDIYFEDGMVALGREREIKDINLVSEQKSELQSGEQPRILQWVWGGVLEG